MAYHQQHDPYYTQQAQYQASYPPASAGPGLEYPPQRQTYDEYDQQSDWDSKSIQSSYAGSQAHLNTQYDMSQAHVHQPVPPLPGYPRNYAPGRPPVLREQSTGGYTTARDKMMKRRSVRQVELYQGNLVLDVQVPTGIIPKGAKEAEEMTTMRYTAATCDPDDFMRSRYSLRQYLYGRQTELFIVMTMYNEDEILFLKTMNA
jgi:chitin synthase